MLENNFMNNVKNTMKILFKATCNIFSFIHLYFFHLCPSKFEFKSLDKSIAKER